MSETSSGDLASRIAADLPYLRRYARALTGSQGNGDRYAAAVLEAILADEAALDPALDMRVALYKALHSIWKTRESTPEESETPLHAAAHKHLARLTKGTREALLLHTIEELDYDQVGAVMGLSTIEAARLVRVARTEMADSVAGLILIIEDEPVIAMDLENLVKELDHKIIGIARTRAEAVTIGSTKRPDLILADIRLADNSSGIDAVNDLLGLFGSLPVIFITAFPEQLLTGARPEPAFLISKPYNDDQIRSAVSQAMFFSSTETLHNQ